MADAGVLPHFAGTLVADPFSSYNGYGTARALCNAHILRDLDGVHHADPIGQAWAKVAANVLTEVNNACHAARDAGRTTLSEAEITTLTRELRPAGRRSGL